MRSQCCAEGLDLIEIPEVQQTFDLIEKTPSLGLQVSRRLGQLKDSLSEANPFNKVTPGSVGK